MIRVRFLALSAAIAALLALNACQSNQPAGGDAPANGSAAAGQGGPQLASHNRPAPQPEPAANLGPTPSVNAAAYVVVNARNGQILASRNPHQRRPVASTQKLLTALVLLERPNLEEMITVAQPDTWVAPTKMGIKPGQRFKKRDLMEAMLVRSSNDIAHCLGRSHAGSTTAFAQLMNRKAKQLGMNNSRFANPSGLTAPGQYSTAYDIAILATHALNNPFIHRATQTREIVFEFPDGSSKLISNTNKLLRTSPYCVGMKTGYTSPAGRCLVSVGKKDFKKVVVVVLGSTVPDIWDGSKALLHWALEVDGTPSA